MQEDSYRNIEKFKRDSLRDFQKHIYPILNNGKMRLIFKLMVKLVIHPFYGNNFNFHNYGLCRRKTAKIRSFLIVKFLPLAVIMKVKIRKIK